MSAADDPGFAERLRRIESLVAAVEATADPAAQANARELLQAVLELHARGIERMLEIGGAQLTEACAADALVGSLLLLHDLHPLDLEARVRKAVETARPQLAAEGCTVELVGLTEGVVRVRLDRRTYGHHTTAETLRQKLADAIWELAPDAEDVEITGTIEPGKPQPVAGAAPLVKLGLPEAREGSSA
jgi:hypothetical protein